MLCDIEWCSRNRAKAVKRAFERMIGTAHRQAAEPLHVQIGQAVVLMHVANEVVLAVLIHQMIGVDSVFLGGAGTVKAGDQIAIDVVRAVVEPNCALVFDGIIEQLDVVEELGVVVLRRRQLVESAQLA